MADTTSAAPSLLPCGECGMPCAPGEYHPYAACLMFKACHNSGTVRSNLEAVRTQPVAREPLTDEQAMELVSAAMQKHGITLTGHGVAFAVDVAKRARGIN